MNILNTLQDRSSYERDVKNHSSWNYRFSSIRAFIKYLIAKGITDVENVEITDIIAYLINYKNTPIKAKGVSEGKLPSKNSEYNVASAIRNFFKYCCIVGKKLKFNYEQIPLMKQDDIKRDPMSKEDYDLLHKAISKYSKSEEIKLRDELMIEIPRETGLRKSELVRLRFRDFHNENRQFRVLVKGGRYESVFFSDRLQKKVFQYEKLLDQKYPHLDIDKIFICLGQKEKGKEISSHLLGKHYRLLVRKMEADGMIPKGKRLCLHMERHSFAMNCVYSGLSQQATTALMRHKDPKITLHYYHMNDTWLLNQYDLIRS